MVLEDFKRPFNILNLILTILFGVMSVYFYRVSRQKREIAVLWSDTSTVFNSKSSTPKISVLDANKKPVTNDILLVTLTFWNSGNLPIDPSDLRVPMAVVFKNCDRVLDYTALKSTDPQLSKVTFETTDVSDSPSDKGIIIHWEHLDPNMGAKCQFIYAGTKPSLASVSARFAGIGNFRSAKPLIEQHRVSRVQVLLAMSAVFVPILLGIFIAEIASRTKGKKRIIAIFGLACVGIVGAYLFHSILLTSLPLPSGLN